jgi:glucose/mannose-6-phosphate isomerase
MSILDAKQTYLLDKEDMYHKIIHLPAQISKAYFSPEIHYPAGISGEEALKSAGQKINRIVIAGMGGSAISGDLIKAAYSHLIPVEVVKDYHLPYVAQNDLLLICSYSGNTEETLSCLRQGIGKTENLAAITSNGIVKKEVEGKYLWCELPMGFPPRAAIGYLFFSLLLILEKLGIVPRKEELVKGTISSLMIKAGAVADSVTTEYNLSKQAALNIFSKIPVIYSANPALAPVAYRFKCQINENAKYPAFHHSLPEMNHNEIEAWEENTLSRQIIPIFLSALNEEENYKKRIAFLQNLFQQEDIEYLHFYAEGENFLERAFSLIYLGDMISYYLALLREVDPTKIDYIIRLKETIG